MTDQLRELAEQRDRDTSEARRFAAEAEEWLAVDPADPGTLGTAQAFATLAVARALLAALDGAVRE